MRLELQYVAKALKLSAMVSLNFAFLRMMDKLIKMAASTSGGLRSGRFMMMCLFY